MWPDDSTTLGRSLTRGVADVPNVVGSGVRHSEDPITGDRPASIDLDRSLTGHHGRSERVGVEGHGYSGQVEGRCRVEDPGPSLERCLLRGEPDRGVEVVDPAPSFAVGQEHIARFVGAKTTSTFNVDAETPVGRPIGQHGNGQVGIVGDCADNARRPDGSATGTAPEWLGDRTSDLRRRPGKCTRTRCSLPDKWRAVVGDDRRATDANSWKPTPEHHHHLVQRRQRNVFEGVRWHGCSIADRRR